MTASVPNRTVRVTPRPGRVPQVLFAVYLALLVWAVLWKLDVPWVGGGDRVVKLVPFLATNAAGPSAPSEVVVNAVLFVPFGGYLALLTGGRRWWQTAVAAAATSLALEVCQYVLAVGRSDLTDVIVNTAGGLVGFGGVALVQRVRGVRATAVVTRAFTIGTALALLVVGLHLASPWRPLHVRDVGPLSRSGALDTPGAPGR